MDETKIEHIYISLIEPDRNQPRKHFDEDSIEELAESVRKYGVLEPLIVQKEEGYYRIIAGERRWRAASKAGLKKVPVIVKDISEKEAAEISLIENIHREDLNPLEEATAYRQYMDTFHITQEELAEVLSKNRSSIAHSLRLLKLHPEVKKMIEEGVLSAGHGKDLVSLPTEEQPEIAKIIAEKKLTVKEAKKEIKPPKKTKKKERSFYYLERELTSTIGTKVTIQKNRRKGTLVIEFYDDDTLDNLYMLLKQYEN